MTSRPSAGRSPPCSATRSRRPGRTRWACGSVTRDASWRMTSMFAVSDRYYGYIRPPYLQVVWPDRRDRYPGDSGFQLRYEGRQPMLWLPRDDNPPGVWTRIDQLG